MMIATDYDTGRIEREWAEWKTQRVAICDCGGEITEPSLYGNLCEICDADAAQAWHDEIAAEGYYDEI